MGASSMARFALWLTELEACLDADDDDCLGVVAFMDGIFSTRLTTTLLTVGTLIFALQPESPIFLHLAVALHAPTEVIKGLLQLEKLITHFRQDGTNETTALHSIVECGAHQHNDHVERLVKAAPDTLLLKNKSGETPLSIVVRSRNCNHDQLLRLLDCYVLHRWNICTEKWPEAKYTFSPVHAAAMCGAEYLESLFDILLWDDLEACCRYDAWGRTPLHWLCSPIISAPVRLKWRTVLSGSVNTLLYVAPQAALMREKCATSRLPLRMAIENGLPFRCVRMLIKHTPHWNEDRSAGAPLCALAPDTTGVYRILRRDPSVLKKWFQPHPPSQTSLFAVKGA